MVILMGSHWVPACAKDQYFGTIEKHFVRIFEVYLLYEEKKPVMLLDATEEKIYAYPYKEFKKALNVSGRTSLTKQYDEAIRGDELVIIMRDRQNDKLISYSWARPRVELFYRFESQHELKELKPAATNVSHNVGGGTRQLYRVRRPGGGPKFTEQKDPTIITALEQMLKDETAGDPMTEQKWIRSSADRLSKRLADEGHQASSSTVARLLKKMGFSLKANKRKQGRSGCPGRDEQFKYIACQKQQFITAGFAHHQYRYKEEGVNRRFQEQGANVA
jgi:hypothetical protein